MSDTKFDAFGKDVPFSRRQKVYETLKEIHPDLTNEQRYSITSYIAEAIKRDDPFRVVGAITDLNKDLALIDLTGRYRLLAEACTD